MTKEQEHSVQEGYVRLAEKGISRRDFLKLCTMSCLALGLNVNIAPKLAEAAVAKVGKKPIIWMQGQGCTGCSSSLLSTADPSPEKLLLDLLSVRYHPTLMAASGHQAVDTWESCLKEGNYLLVLEGSIPRADSRFCTVEGEAFLDQFLKAAAKAELVIAAGSCAAYGGIPRAGVTGAVGARDVLKDKKFVNLPSCPVKPDRLIGLTLYYLANKDLPRLDKLGRPLEYYRYALHDSCFRRMHYEKGEFLQDWNEPKTKDWCLYEKGCKGKSTFTNCARQWWNEGVSFCLSVGSPCSGCSEPEFVDKLGPLFTNPKGVK